MKRLSLLAAVAVASSVQAYTSDYGMLDPLFLQPGQTEINLSSSGFDFNRTAVKYSFLDFSDKVTVNTTNIQLDVRNARSTKMVFGGGLQYTGVTSKGITSNGTETVQASSKSPSVVKAFGSFELWNQPNVGNRFEISFQRTSAGEVTDSKGTFHIEDSTSTVFQFRSDAVLRQKFDPKTLINLHLGSYMSIEGIQEVESTNTMSLTYLGLGGKVVGKRFMSEDFALTGQVKYDYQFALNASENGMTVDLGDNKLSSSIFNTAVGFSYRF